MQVQIVDRQAIENLLFKAGSQHSFYCLLIQYDRFVGEVRTAANAVVATDLWNKTYRLTGHTADVLDTQLLLLLNQVSSSLNGVNIVPPADNSAWKEFYLSAEQYEQAVGLLDRVISFILDPVVS